MLRGLLLTGGAPLYLRAELAGHEAAAAQPRRRRAARARSPRERSGGRPARSPAATSRPTSPPPARVALGREPLVDRDDRAASGAAPDGDDALELALLLADEDARAGDYRQALHALDARRGARRRRAPGRRRGEARDVARGARQP